MHLKNIDLIAFITAYLFAIETLNQVMGYILGKDSGVMVINVMIILSLLTVNFFFNRHSAVKKIGVKSSFFIGFYVIVFIFNILYYENSSISSSELVVYCVLPMIVSASYSIQTEKILRYLTYLSLIILPFVSRFFSVDTLNADAGETIGMSSSYNIMVFTMAAILHFVYFRKQGNKILFAAYIANAFYLIKTIQYGTRGIFVCYMVLIFLIYFNKYDEHGMFVENGIKKLFILIVVLTASIFVVWNFSSILNSVNGFFTEQNVHIYALTKSIMQMEGGDLSNGRNMIVKFIIEGLKERLITGHGIGMITHNSNGVIVYPHNIFLQLLYDLGMAVSLPLLYLIGKGIMLLTGSKRLKKEYAVALLLFFCTSVPKLCFSTQLWTSTAFWFMVMCLICRENFEQEEKNKLYTYR